MKAWSIRRHLGTLRPVPRCAGILAETAKTLPVIGEIITEAVEIVVVSVEIVIASGEIVAVTMEIVAAGNGMIATSYEYGSICQHCLSAHLEPLCDVLLSRANYLEAFT
jgi:hypothetical protein